MNKHTQEPWRVSLEDSTPEWSVITADGGRVVANVNEETGPELIAGVPVMRVMPGELNARRIVACVNACHNLSNDELEQKGLVTAISARFLAAERSRDELLAALEGCVQQLSAWMRDHGHDLATQDAVSAARAAIAKAKGGAA